MTVAAPPQRRGTIPADRRVTGGVDEDVAGVGSRSGELRMQMSRGVLVVEGVSLTPLDARQAGRPRWERYEVVESIDASGSVQVIEEPRANHVFLDGR